MREFPISSIQKNALQPKARPNAQLSLSFGEPIDRNLWKNAWSLLLEQHPILRSTLCAHGTDTFSLLEHDHLDNPWIEVDWTALDLPLIAKQWPELQAKELNTPLTANEHPLWRITLLLLPQNQCHLLLTFHPVLLDEQSLSQLLRQWFAFYEALRSGSTPSIQPTTSYAAAIGSIDLSEEAASSIWKEHLEKWNARNPFACFAPDPNLFDTPWYKTKLDLDIHTSQALSALTKELNTDIGTLVAIAWGMVICRFGGNGHALIGISASARPLLDETFKSILGPYENVLPFHVQEPLSSSLRNWLESAVTESKKLEACIFSNLIDCAKAIASSAESNLPPDTELTGQASPSHSSKDTKLPLDILTDVRWHSRTINHSLHSEMPRWLGADAQYFESFTTPVAIRCVGEQRIEIEFHIDRTTFAPNNFENLTHAFKELLVTFAENPTLTLSDVFPSPTLEQPNAFQLAVEPDLLARTQTSLSINASAEAVKHGQNALTYSEIDTYSNQLVRFLRKIRNNQNTPIAVCLNHTPWAVVILVALIKDRNSVFFIPPFMPCNPPADLNKHLENANCTLLLTDSAHGDLFPEGTAKKILIDEVWDKISQQADSPLQIKQSTGDFFFAFFDNVSQTRGKNSTTEDLPTEIPPSFVSLSQTNSTSGLNPLLIPESCFDQNLNAALRLYNLNTESKLLSTATPGTPEFVQEMLVSINSGATLIQPINDISATRSAFQEAIKENTITHLQISSAWWTQWIQFLAELKQSVPSSLERLIVATGQLSPAIINAWETVAGRPIDIATFCSPLHLPGMGFSNFAAPSPNTSATFGPLVVGTNTEGVEALIVDRFSRELPSLCQGEIILRTLSKTDGGKQQDRPLDKEKAAGSLTSNWYRPGWRGYRIDNTYYLLDFPDRFPQSLRSFDAQQQIRKAILKHPAILDVIIDESESHELAAWLIMREADAPVPDTLAQLISDNLPPHLRPQSATTLPRIPLDRFERIDISALPKPKPLPKPPESKLTKSPLDILRSPLPSDTDSLSQAARLEIIRSSETRSPLVLMFEDPQTTLLEALQTEIPLELPLANLKLSEEHWREDNQFTIKEACACIRGTMRRSPTYLISGGSTSPLAIQICHRLRKDRTTRVKLVLINPEIPTSFKSTAFQLWNQLKEFFTNLRGPGATANTRLNKPAAGSLNYLGPLWIITETKPNPLWKKHFPNAKIQQHPNLNDALLTQLLKQLVEN